MVASFDRERDTGSFLRSMGITYTPSPNRGYAQGRRIVRALTWHVTDGRGESALSWLTNPASGASSNYLVMDDGQIHCLVPGQDAAWANGRVEMPNTSLLVVRETVYAGINPNLVTVSIEVAGVPRWRGGPGWSPKQRNVLVELSARLCWRFGLTADRQHILAHSDWDSIQRRGCPGLTAVEMAELIARTRTRTRELRGW